jgi:hypothetical protein
MEIEKYINDVVNAIEREILFRFQNLNKTVKKYIYFFNNHGLPNHPPYSISKTKTYIYQNDYENIYPIKEIIKKLSESLVLAKFINYKILLNDDKTGIIIDWNF